MPRRHRLDPRRREPPQRRHRARPLQDRGHRSRRRVVLPVGCLVAARRQRHRRHRRRARRRLRGAPGSPPDRRHADRGGDRAPLRLPRVSAGGCARRLRRARGGDDRRLHGLVHARADDRQDAALRQRVLGAARVPRQRAALRARRAAAARRSRRRLPITGALLRDALWVSLAVVAIRLVWAPIFTYVPRYLFQSIRDRDPYPPWQCAGRWSPGRACAAPSRSRRRSPCRSTVPDRDLIVFVTFAVILVTLVGQGLTLPALIRVLGVADDGGAEREDAKARIKAAEAALARLDELAVEGWVYDDTLERLRGPVPLPHEPLPGALRRRRRRRRRGALAAVPAAPARAAGRRARRGAAPAERGPDHRGGDAARAARHRPRGLCGSTST